MEFDYQKTMDEIISVFEKNNVSKTEAMMCVYNLPEYIDKNSMIILKPKEGRYENHNQRHTKGNS